MGCPTNIPTTDNTAIPCPEGYVDIGCIIYPHAIPFIGVQANTPLDLLISKMVDKLKQQELIINLLKQANNGE